jgi:hypothetical protein
MKITTHIATFIAAATLTANAGNVVCVGINEYAERTNLEHAENDARTVADIFETQGHTVTTILGADATRDAIRAAITADTDIIYFAGHGISGSLIVADGEFELSYLADSNATLLIDACFIGSGLKLKGNVKVLAAAKRRAFEANGHGLFTKHLIDWLNKGGEFVADEISSYVAAKVRKETGGWQKTVLGYI